MCGICGVVLSDQSRPIDGPLLDRMTAALRHRGPDGPGVHLAPGIGLGVQRLSIVDLVTGDQPIASEDGAVVMVCNGEIYNSPELRADLESRGHRFRTRSDVEVIVHLYEDEGIDCLRRLRGMFGLALWDAHRRRAILARDRLGIKPLHYAVGRDGLYFGSEMKAILATGRIRRELDVRALDDLFSFGFVTGPRTLLAGVRRVLPGECLVYAGGALSPHRYWRPSFPDQDRPAPVRSEGEWAECVRAKLEEVVRIHLRSDVPVGAFLSTGIDSSSVVALASRMASGPIPTFTLAHQDPADDETRGRETLDRYEGFALTNERVACGPGAFDLYPKALWHAEDPSASGLEIPGLLLAEAASRHVKVVLTGEGADEIFGGYIWFRRDRLVAPLALLPAALRRLLLLGPLAPSRHPWTSRMLLAPHAMNRARYRALIGLLHPDVRHELFSARIEQRLGEVDTLDEGAAAEEEGRGWTRFARLQYHELTVRMPALVVHALDRGSMAHGVEARVPFLDHELVELCARIPPALKLRGRQEKYILRQAMRGVLPPEVLRRKKHGLAAPVYRWLRGHLPPFAEDLLSADRLRDKGYFVPDAVSRLRERCRQRDRSPEDYVLMAVLATQLWDDLFMKAPGPFDETVVGGTFAASTGC
jgi:asparagine synthase (glutamine-hydrolysing)